jgi:hypothetical protein
MLRNVIVRRMLRMDAMPPMKRLEFMTVMIWVALFGAAIILFIDYQIKHSILEESAKAWERINVIGLDAITRGADVKRDETAIDVAGDMGGDISPDTDTRMEVAAMASSPAKPRKPRAKTTALTPARARNSRVSPSDKQVPE